MNQRMKKAALILAFFACFVNYKGFAGGGNDRKAIREATEKIETKTPKIEDQTPNISKEISNISDKVTEINDKIPPKGRDNSSTALEDRIPLTPRIVEFLMQKDGSAKDLKFYLSKPFTMKIKEQSETAEIEIKDNMVILNPANPANEIPIEFTSDSEGILIEIPGPDKGSEVKILFQNENKTLVFKRDKGRNGYVLSSVISNAKRPYKIYPSEVIQLLVSGQDRRQAEVKVASIDFEYPAPKPEAQHYQPYQTYQTYNNTNAGYAVDHPYIAPVPSRNIMDGGSISPESVIKLVEKRNHPALSKNDFAIIHEYFKEAEYEGVNADIAIAQMLFVTDFLRSKRVMSTHNYAGLSNVPPKFTGSFGSMTEGVRAHIQHLKAYVREYPKQVIVDPRIKLAYDIGNQGMQFAEVCRLWAPQNPNYGKKIEDILSELYSIQSVM